MPEWIPRKRDWGLAFFVGLLFIIFICTPYFGKGRSFPHVVWIVVSFLILSVPMAFNSRFIHRIIQNSPRIISKKKRVCRMLILLPVLFFFYWTERTVLASANGSLGLLLAILFHAGVLMLLCWLYARLAKKLPKN